MLRALGCAQISRFVKFDRTGVRGERGGVQSERKIEFVLRALNFAEGARCVRVWVTVPVVSGLIK